MPSPAEGVIRATADKAVQIARGVGVGQSVKTNLIGNTKRRRNTVKSSIRDKTEGTVHQVKGKVKEIAGKLSDNPKLKVEGVIEKTAGKIQKKVGNVKDVLGK